MFGSNKNRAMVSMKLTKLKFFESVLYSQSISVMSIVLCIACNNRNRISFFFLSCSHTSSFLYLFNHNIIGKNEKHHQWPSPHYFITLSLYLDEGFRERFMEEKENLKKKIKSKPLDPLIFPFLFCFFYQILNPNTAYKKTQYLIK